MHVSKCSASVHAVASRMAVSAASLITEARTFSASLSTDALIPAARAFSVQILSFLASRLLAASRRAASATRRRFVASLKPEDLVLLSGRRRRVGLPMCGSFGRDLAFAFPVGAATGGVGTVTLAGLVEGFAEHLLPMTTSGNCVQTGSLGRCGCCNRRRRASCRLAGTLDAAGGGLARGFHSTSDSS